MKLAYSYIRWSSEKQTDGDSLRRQTDAATAYAAKHSLTLADETYLDAGVSADKGKNVEEGALSVFLLAVKQGVIAKGSYLLVENFDRLTRLKPRIALRLLQDIVDLGITLVTLTDEKQFSTASLDANWTDFIVALADMARAHGENRRKADSVKAAWDDKRSKDEPMTAMGPAWLVLNKAEKKWEFLPDKVAAVQKVFGLAASGLGSPSIANKMNEAGIPTMGKAEYWEAGIVAAMLRNQAVIGRLVPRNKELPPKDAYPPIIDPDVFHLVQEHINGRAANRGKTGTNVANLFAGIIRCECGSRMRFVSGAKPHLYLRCLKAYSNAGCDAPIIPYGPLEADIMRMVLVWAKLPLDSTKIADPTIAIRAELEDKRRQLANFEKVIRSGGIDGDVPAPKMLLTNVALLEVEIERLKQQLKTVTVPTPISSAVREAVLLWQACSSVFKTEPATGKAVTGLRGKELKDMRFRLQAECKRMFTKIVVEKTIEHGESRDYLTYVLYGPIVAANPFEPGSVPMFTEDGGWREQFSCPQWGFGRRRKAAPA